MAYSPSDVLSGPQRSVRGCGTTRRMSD